MRKRKTVFNLTNREMDILNILWNAEEPLVASEIARREETLTVNTVQATLRKLLKQELIEVADIVYSGTVLSRSYRPTEKSKDFAVQEFSAQIQHFKKNITPSRLVATLLEHEEDTDAALEEIEQLEAILKKKKELLKKKGE